MKPLILCTLGLLVCATSVVWYLLLNDDPQAVMLDLGTVGVRYEPMVDHGWQPTAADLMNARRVDREVFSKLRKFPSLKELNLSNPLVRDDTLSFLCRLPWIEVLYLGSSSISDDSVSELAKLPHLHTLNLGDTAIGDRAIVHLQSLPNVRYLYLGNTHISDAALVHLEAMPGLKILDLNGTRVTPEGIDRLRRARPDLDVYN